MIQIMWTVLILCIGGVLGVCLGPRIKGNPSTEATAPVIGKITELADLVVLRVPVSKVHVTKLGGYVGSVSCVVLVHGELELGTDLKKARWEDVDTDTCTATLVLEEPVVRRARLDHDQTSVYRIDRGGLWKGMPCAEPARRIVNQGMTEAQGCVEAAGDDSQYVDRAKKDTEQVLSQFLTAFGWEVRIEWAGNQPI
tara:strand:- start:1125 stop:1715 length:591 start_codon:yes stop_codon:yes gene_type:complete